VLVKRHSRWILLLAVVAACAVLPADVFAQRRAVPRPAVRPVYVSARPYYRPYYYRPYYYRPYYYSPYYYSPLYYSPFFYGGYSGWYSGFGVGFGWSPYSYYGGPYPYPYYGYGYYGSSARIQVKPQHAEVFIDGYFVGTVDDFDGWSQRLNVEPGEHELIIYLAGHRTYRQPVLFRPGATIKIEHVMQPLAAGDPDEGRPQPPQSPSRPAYRRDDDQQPPPPRRSMPPPSRDTQSQDYGGVAIRVQPMDAEVIVDGDRWESPAGDVTLQLTEGTHRVEVRKDGYRSYTAEVRVKRGDTTTLNVSLSRQ
jgi:PEGA domain